MFCEHYRNLKEENNGVSSLSSQLYYLIRKLWNENTRN
jgi:hypothetical protein